MTLLGCTRAILRRGATSYVIVQLDKAWRVDKITGGTVVDCRQLHHLPRHISTAIGGRTNHERHS